MAASLGAPRKAARALTPGPTSSVEAETARRLVTRCKPIAPAFSADCIETLEEINGEIREAFEHAGGESFTYIPCLNDDPAHIQALVAVIEDNLTGWLPR